MQRLRFWLFGLCAGTLLAGCMTTPSAPPSEALGLAPAITEAQRLKARAQRVEIIRDDSGVPHIYGKTDADAVFGLLYAQAEDDFPRIERNY